MAHAGHDHSNLKETVAFRSILVSAFITIAKAIGGVLTGSLALISDALHSLLDVVFTTITWLAIRKAHQPADADHQFGHGKIESVAALIETVFLLLLAGIIGIEGVKRLSTGSGEVIPHWFAIAILFAAIGLDAWRWFTLKRVAKATNSEALEADALHFASDLVNSVMVLAALVGVWLGFKQADAVAALIVAAFIAVSGIRLAIRTINTLIDTAPAGISELIQRTVEDIPGVAVVENVRARPAGGDVFAEVNVLVSRTLPLDKVVKVKDNITEAIQKVVPNVDLTVIANPAQLDDETMFERVMLISAKQRLPLHNVIIQNIDGKLSVSCDLEVDGRLSLGAAHMLATKLETAIRNEFGEDTEVDTHIEPLNPKPLSVCDLRSKENEKIALCLKEMAQSIGLIEDIHSVRARTSDAGLVVNYHCYVDASENVTTVHKCVDQLERMFRSQHPDVIRVVGHAEPKRKA
ncbi:cation diffusion facilitator family transporter [Microvirga sp. W0021]|uniref:Cation diffusion facilitator family transporter n=1 Tax=Hohaiivirga grylli TaxID=3133970 RepID=A0ABV0BIG1_9HYPH